MTSSIEHFWVPVASVLPVFILALAVETRSALPIRTKRQLKVDRRQPRWVQAVDTVASIAYGLIYMLAMLLLLLSFASAIGVLASGEVDGEGNASAVASTYLTVLIGAVMTGLLPVARIAFGAVMDRIRPGSTAEG